MWCSAFSSIKNTSSKQCSGFSSKSSHCSGRHDLYVNPELCQGRWCHCDDTMLDVHAGLGGCPSTPVLKPGRRSAVWSGWHTTTWLSALLVMACRCALLISTACRQMVQR
jgi:hypothetical protein